MGGRGGQAAHGRVADQPPLHGSSDSLPLLLCHEGDCVFVCAREEGGKRGGLGRGEGGKTARKGVGGGRGKEREEVGWSGEEGEEEVGWSREEGEERRAKRGGMGWGARRGEKGK